MIYALFIAWAVTVGPTTYPSLVQAGIYPDLAGCKKAGVGLTHLSVFAKVKDVQAACLIIRSTAPARHDG